MISTSAIDLKPHQRPLCMWRCACCKVLKEPIAYECRGFVHWQRLLSMRPLYIQHVSNCVPMALGPCRSVHKLAQYSTWTADAKSLSGGWSQFGPCHWSELFARCEFPAPCNKLLQFAWAMCSLQTLKEAITLQQQWVGRCLRWVGKRRLI